MFLKESSKEVSDFEKEKLEYEMLSEEWFPEDPSKYSGNLTKNQFFTTKKKLKLDYRGRINKKKNFRVFERSFKWGDWW